MHEVRWPFARWENKGRELLGEVGFLISIASTNLALGQRYFRAGQERDAAKLGAMAVEFEGIIACLKEAVADGAHMDGAFDKMFCRVQDEAFPLRLLPPYSGVSEEAFRKYVALVRERHPQWLPGGQ
jgi:hypothetical protein